MNWKVGDTCKFVVGEADDPLYVLKGVITEINKGGREGTEYYVDVIDDDEYSCGCSYVLYEYDLMLPDNEDNFVEEDIEEIEENDPVKSFVDWVFKTYNDDIPIYSIYELYKKTLSNE